MTIVEHRVISALDIRMDDTLEANAERLGCPVEGLMALLDAEQWACPHVRDGVAAAKELGLEPVNIVRFDSKEQVSPWVSQLCGDCTGRVVMFMMRTCGVRPPQPAHPRETSEPSK